MKRLSGQPLKLKDGTWGAWVDGDHGRDDLPGREVEIRTRSGKSWDRKVERVLWSGASSCGDKSDRELGGRQVARVGGLCGEDGPNWWTGGRDRGETTTDHATAAACRRAAHGASLRPGGDMTMDSRSTLKAVAAEPALTVGSSLPGDALFKGGEFWGLPLDEESVPVTKDHLLRCQHAREELERWLKERGLEGYVGSDQSLYWDRSDVRRVLSPDVFVAVGVSSRSRRNYRIWAEGPTPCFVLEFLSPSTRRRDLGEKKRIYEEIGILEYFIHEGEDPEDTDGTRRRGPRIDPPLQGFRLRRRGASQPRYEPIPARRGVSYPAPGVALGYASESLGLDVTFDADRDGVRFFDAASNAFVLTPAEAAEARAETAEIRAAGAEARVAELERLVEQGDN